MSCSLLLLILSALGANAQMRQCATGVTECPTSAPFTTVSTTSDSTYTYFSSTTCPPYHGNHTWSNPNAACDQNMNYSLPHTPRYASVPIPTGQRIGVYAGVHYLSDNPAPILGAIGVLVNGVVVYGPSAVCGGHTVCPDQDPNAPSRYVDAFEAEGRTLDQCGGHPDGRTRYHLHTGVNFTTSSGRVACSLPTDTPGEHSVLLGYMFDGFPMYGQYSQGGRRPTQLDSCSGHTHMINGKMQYHYHMPNDFPWMIGCFKGCPIVSNNRNQLRFSTTNVTYGCPNGLATDPNPLYEDAINTTATSSMGPTPTSSMEATPSSSVEATPTSSVEATPSSSMEATPSSSMEATPTSSVEATPTSSMEATPSSSVEATPSSGVSLLGSIVLVIASTLLFYISV